MLKSKWFAALLVTAFVAMLAVACAAPAPTPAPVATSAPVIQTSVVVQTSAPQVQTAVVVQTSAPQVITATPPPPGATPLPAGSIKLNGAGGTFPLPIYTQWNFAYKYADPSVVINYQGVGSGAGKAQIIAGTVDYAGSDSLFSDAEKKAASDAGRTLQMFPTLASAIVPIVNIPEITQTLTIDGPTLANIYLAKITKWNDPAIVKLNPNYTMPDKPITVVHRSDGSGTTEIFTKYLAKVSTDWASGPGGASSVQWPVDKAGNGVGGKGNPGVAAAVQATPYSIGYVEISFAKQNGIQFMDMINAAGTHVAANGDTLASAISDYGDKFDPDLTIAAISNGPGTNSWPISGYTYLITPTNWKADASFGCLKAQKFFEYVYWFNTDPGAASQAVALGYATLPSAVRAKVFSTLATIQCDGKPIPNKFSGS